MKIPLWRLNLRSVSRARCPKTGLEMLVRVEAKPPLEVSHFLDSKCSSVDVSGSGLGSSVANSLSLAVKLC
jgi:hypothetical protein